MMKLNYTVALLLLTAQLTAQIPEEALRLSWISQNGTARNQAIGGAMGSLGGDATAALVNPAGLAFFKTSDFLLTPSMQFSNTKSSFRGTSLTGNRSGSFTAGTSGFVFGGFGNQAKNSFALTITRLADFQQTLAYKGQNDYSSFAEPLADEFASSNLTIDQALNSNQVSLATKLALYTYLVDTATINGTPQVISRSENSSLLNQEHKTNSSGGMTEISFAAGHEFSKKFMAGGTLGLPFVKLERSIRFTEADATGNNDNDFSYMAFNEHYSISGIGVNLKLGFIYRPVEYVRVGLALHSPSALLLKERYDAGMAADLEHLFYPNPGYDSAGLASITGNSYAENEYTLYTPGKIILSGSYVFREVEDTRRQKGFLTADIEFVNYKWNQFGPAGDVTEETKSLYTPYNDVIDALSKAAFNFRIGGEVKFNIVMARLGLAYYGSPYKDKALKAGKLNLSGGIGYRHKGIFADLTYVHKLTKDVHFPYRLNAPRANSFATLKDNGGTALLTIGVKI